jgi:hypothetical protein
MADRRGDRGVGGGSRFAGGSGAAALIEVEVRDGLGLDRVVRVGLVHVGAGIGVEWRSCWEGRAWRRGVAVWPAG